MPATGPSLIGETVAHYHILSRLGGGGMGIVYKAEDTKLERTVALKFLPAELTREEDARNRFLREARAAAKLDHPNICTVYEIGEAGERPWIAMACYDGETLEEKISRGQSEVEEVIDLASQIARGLGRAHLSGIIHRDIKPANVIMAGDGVAKILDFGIAKLTDTTKITGASTTLGTVAYMSPEQLRGETVGPPTDLWALGVVMFELLTGERPFGGDYPEALAYAILNEQPASLTGLREDTPAELEQLVRRLLRKDPLQRYQSAEEVLEELELLKAPSSGSGRTGPREARPRSALAPGARLGPYEIEEALGSGGMGDVYRARDTRLDRLVAIKVLAPEFSEDAERKQRFQKEAKTISSLSHPNICTLFDVGEQEGVDYLVMECLEGGTLADRLRKGAIPLSELLKIGAQIGEALGRAHQQGIVHRDLKPGNVMLTETGTVKLVDFGLAKDIGAITSSPRSGETPDKPLTAEGAIVGTLAYMAPEQVEGRMTDARSDIFALGAILYEMATGRRAFDGTTKASLIATILEREPPGIAEVKRGASDTLSGARRSLAVVEHIIRRCLEKDPERRWQNALDVANELRWVTERGVEAEEPAGARILAHRWSMVAALVLIVLITTVSTLTLRDLLTEEPVPERRMLSVEAPEGTWLHFATPSPDGTSILMDAVETDREPREAHLWVRSLTTGELRRLEGTKNITRPIWSPDGEWIAFFQPWSTATPNQRILIKTRLDGTSGLIAITELEKLYLDGAWGPDGMILYSVGPQRPLYRVPDTGGVPEPATTLESGETGHLHPCLLPDGRFLFYVDGDAEQRGIYVQGPADSGKKLVLRMNVPWVWMVPTTWTFVDEHILLYAGHPQSVTSRRLDLKTLELGEPQKFELPWSTFHALEWSDLDLVVAVETTFLEETHAVWLDRKGVVLGTFGEDRSEVSGDPSISPDETRVILSRNSTADESFALVSYDPRGESPRIVYRGQFVALPVWSADGRSIFFRGRVDGDDNSSAAGVVRKAVEGAGKPELVVEGGCPMDVSRDGRWLLYSKDCSNNIWLMDLNEPDKGVCIVEERAGQGELSPDSKWLAYTSNMTGRPEVYIRNLSSTKTVRVSTKGGVEPLWRGDQRELFYLRGRSLGRGRTDEREIVSVSIETRGDELIVGSEQVLFKARIHPFNQSWDVTADGQRFLATTKPPVPTPTSARILQNWFNPER